MREAFEVTFFFLLLLLVGIVFYTVLEDPSYPGWLYKSIAEGFK